MIEQVPQATVTVQSEEPSHADTSLVTEPNLLTENSKETKKKPMDKLDRLK